MTTGAIKSKAVRRVSCFTCHGRARTEWGALHQSDLTLLDELKVHNNYQPGQVVFYQGNPCLGIYCIEEGIVALRKSDHEGNTMIMRLAHDGQTLGYRSYFSGEPYSASAYALSEVRICFIDRAGVARLLELNLHLGLKFLNRLARDLKDAEDSRLHAATLPVRARLANLLLTLKDRFATADNQGRLTIELPLSRQDVAAMIGTRPETVARTIRSLEEDGVATFHGRQVLVSDLDALLDELEASTTY